MQRQCLFSFAVVCLLSSAALADTKCGSSTTDCDNGLYITDKNGQPIFAREPTPLAKKTAENGNNILNVAKKIALGIIGEFTGGSLVGTFVSLISGGGNDASMELI